MNVVLPTKRDEGVASPEKQRRWPMALSEYLRRTRFALRIMQRQFYFSASQRNRFQVILKRIVSFGPNVFAMSPTALLAALIDGASPNGSNQEGKGLAPEFLLVAPKPHERLLHDVLCIREGTGPLASKEQELWAVSAKPVFPVIMRFLHAVGAGLVL